MLDGPEIVGGVVSRIVTVKVLVVTLPAASVATLVTGVVPFGKTVPEAGVLTTVTPGQLSAPVTVKLTTASHLPASVLTTIGAGTVRVGGSVSLTVTVKEHVVALPTASVAVALTTVVPFGKELPEAWLKLTVTPGQLSVAVAAKVTTALH